MTYERIGIDRRYALALISAGGVSLANGLMLGPASARDIETTSNGPSDERLAALAAAAQPKVIAWRRDFHQHPELSNREFRTAKVAAAELKKLGLEVYTGVGKTGVVGILKGAQPGPAVALRSDMDALPVEDRTGEPFASKATGELDGKIVPVAHACGHDCHMAMLLGAASVLVQMKADIKGDVVFIFQPAEEGPPVGEEGGAALMIKEGVLDKPPVQSIFGIHVWPGKSGTISYRPNGFMAASDRLEIRLKGVQTHGSSPWRGVDITALASDCVAAINQIAARQLDITAEPTVITIASMHGGLRYNIIPEEFVMGGTMRTFSPERRKVAIDKVTHAVKALADSYGAQAEVNFTMTAPLTHNDPTLSAGILPALIKAAGGADNVNAAYMAITAAEDFSQYQAHIPGVFCFLGSCKPGEDPETVPSNHSPYFDVYEPALEVGVRAHVLAAFYMLSRKV